MTIPVNKKRFPVVFVAGLIVSVLLAMLIADTIKHFNDKGYNNSIYLGGYIALLIWSAALTIFSFLEYIKTKFDRTAVLTITGDGINDNLSIFSVGDIPWAEITGVNISKAYKTSFLVISVSDPQTFITRKGRFKQRTLKSFSKKFGSPIVISQKRIDYDLAVLREILISSKPVGIIPGLT